MRRGRGSDDERDSGGARLPDRLDPRRSADPLVGITRRIRPAGLVVAVVGFLLSRFAVTRAASETAVVFLLAGLVPLAGGLGLSTFGVALAVGPFDRDYVRRTAVWCLAGTAGMALLIGLSTAGRIAEGGMWAAMVGDTRSADVVLGGAIGGTLTGIYAARSRRRRERLRRQADRLGLLNHVVRDEVLNAVTVIRGRAGTLDGDGAERAAETIRERADGMEAAVEDLKFLTRSREDGPRATSLAAAVDAAADRFRERHPDGAVDVDMTDAAVWADGLLEHALGTLFEHAAGPAARVSVTAAVGEAGVELTVRGDGDGPTAAERALLRDEGDYADPRTAVELDVARLLVEPYGGVLEVDDDGDDAGLVLRLNPAGRGRGPFDAGDPEDRGVSVRGLLTAVGASLVAGAAMGAVLAVAADTVPVVGALYGVADPTVGWITHEFHSVVFGLSYAGTLAALPRRYTAGLRGSVGVGLAWGVWLWLVAAGVVMPLWLRLIGVPTPLPNLTVPSLTGHLVWGLALGTLYHLGERRLAGPGDRPE